MSSVVAALQVFAIDDGSWTTHDGLNEKYHVSDLTGFAGPDGLAYFVAGYDFNYTAQTTVFSIDPVASTANNTLVIQEQASLPTARGDASAVTAKDKESGDMYALVTGGFTDQNDFCDPLNTTERYDFTSGAWSDTNNLVVPRGDEALVVLNDRIYALGGERQYEARCYASPNDTPDPGEETVPIVDVEWYNETSDTWTVIEDLPRHRFRFAAIGYKNAIYSFGGQLAFDASCNCFRTSDEVIVYKEVTSDAVATSPALVACLYLTIAGLALWM